MPRLSRAQEDTQRHITRIATGGYPPEELGGRLLDALQLALPADGQRLFGVDPQTLLFNRLLAASEGDGPFRHRWLRDSYLATDPVLYASPLVVMRAGLTTVIYRNQQESCWGFPPSLLAQISSRDHARIFLEHLTPPGGSLRTCFRAEGQVIAMLDIVRRQTSRPWQPTDAAFLRFLAPAIGGALAAAFSREQALHQNGSTMIPEASGIILLDSARRVRFMTPSGEAWLTLLWDTHAHEHAPLPTAIWSVVAGLHSTTDRDGWRAANTVVVPTSVGPIRIEASPGGEDGSTAIVVSPVRPPAPPDIPRSWCLTAQERQVASLLVRGLSNRQLADALCVSEHTVETHLGHIYEKLSIRGRSQLLARLFRETYPALCAESSLQPLP